MNALDTAIFTQLKGGTALTALLTNGTAGIFVDHAGNSASMPYVIFNEQSAVWDQTMGASRFVNALYQVKAVSGSAYPKQAKTIDEQIDARLHNATLTVSGYGVMAVTRESDIVYSEQSGDQVFQHFGALYRVEMQKGV